MKERNGRGLLVRGKEGRREVTEREEEITPQRRGELNKQ